MWYPRERFGGRRRIFFLRLERGEETVELPIAHDVQGRRRNVLALLIARCDKAGAWIDADGRLAKAVAQHRGVAAVRGNAQHAAVVFALVRGLLPAFRNDELTLRRQ